MRVIKPSAEIINVSSETTNIEYAARLCYQSQDKIKEESDKTLLKLLTKKGHDSVFEHVSISVHIICDRGVLAELTRHRLASFSVESTRYVNYKKGITVIKPVFYKEGSLKYEIWKNAMEASELVYKDLINLGSTPQEARSVLPNSLKTELLMTANLREWKHIFKLRCNKKAHPQIREIMVPLFYDFINIFPIYFEGVSY